MATNFLAIFLCFLVSLSQSIAFSVDSGSPVDSSCIKLPGPFDPTVDQDFSKGGSNSALHLGYVVTVDEIFPVDDDDLCGRFSPNPDRFFDNLLTFVIRLGEESRIVNYYYLTTIEFSKKDLQKLSEINESSGGEDMYLAWRFLAYKIRLEIMNLPMDVDHVVVEGIKPTDCGLYYFWEDSDKYAECVKKYYDWMLELSLGLRYMVDALVHQLPAAKLAICDMNRDTIRSIVYNHRIVHGFGPSRQASCRYGEYVLKEKM